MQSSRGNGVSPHPSRPSDGGAGKRGFPAPFQAVRWGRGETGFPRTLPGRPMGARGNGVSPHPSRPSDGGAGKPGFPTLLQTAPGRRTPRHPTTVIEARAQITAPRGGITLMRARSQTVRRILTAGLEQVVARCAGGSKKPLLRQGLAGNRRGTTREASLSRGRPIRRLPVRKPHGDALRDAQRACAQLLADVHTTSQKPARRHQKARGVNSDRRDDDIRFVFGVACCAVPGAFPERETRHQNVTGGASTMADWLSRGCIIHPLSVRVNMRFLAFR